MIMYPNMDISAFEILRLSVGLYGLNGSGDLHVLVRRIQVGGFGQGHRCCSCWLKSSLVDHEAGSHEKVTSTFREPPPGV
jgi:hypothetical protein